MEENKEHENNQENGENFFETLASSEETLQQRLTESQSFAEKNKNILLGIAVAIALAVGGYFFMQFSLFKNIMRSCNMSKLTYIFR